jgi:hypothetical protein
MEEGFWKWGLTALCLIAIIVIIIWRLWPLITFKKRAIQVPGLITNWISARKGNKTIYRPIISFKTREGELITLTSEDRCEGSPLYEKGTRVEILYDPKDAEKIKVIYPSKL